MLLTVAKTLLCTTVLVIYQTPVATNQLVNEFGQNVKLFNSQQNQFQRQQNQFQNQQNQFQPQKTQFQPQQDQFQSQKDQHQPQQDQFHDPQELFLPQSEQLQTSSHRPVTTYNPKREDGEECISGFSVRKSLRTSLKAKSQIKFQDILTNAGGWDSNNHAFIAPCSGIYFFTFNAVSEEKKGFTLALMKNDKFQVTAYGGKEGYQWGSNSAMLFLNPDDIVFLQLQDGEIYEHPYNEAYTTFTGFLVNKI